MPLDNYEPVDERLKRFLKDHEAQGPRVLTELMSGTVDLKKVVFKASIYVGETLVATGWATETEGSSNVNRDSHLENCETSAIGRALANYGYSGSHRPSREEMAKVERKTAERAVVRPAPVQSAAIASGPPDDGAPPPWEGIPVGAPPVVPAPIRAAERALHVNPATKTRYKFPFDKPTFKVGKYMDEFKDDWIKSDLNYYHDNPPKGAKSEDYVKNLQAEARHRKLL